jgi:hypothetical protein
LSETIIEIIAIGAVTITALVLLYRDEVDFRRTTASLAALAQGLPLRPQQLAPPRTHPLILVRIALVSFPILVLSLVANIAQILGPFWPTPPRIIPAPPTLGPAFNVPFQIENKSTMFALEHVQIRCVFDKVLMGPLIITNSRVYLKETGSIAPDTPAWYICPFQGTVPPDTRILSATIHFWISYDSPWPNGNRVDYMSEPFTLNVDSVPVPMAPGRSASLKTDTVYQNLANSSITTIF